MNRNDYDGGSTKTGCDKPRTLSEAEELVQQLEVILKLATEGSGIVGEIRGHLFGAFPSAECTEEKSPTPSGLFQRLSELTNNIKTAISNTNKDLVNIVSRCTY